jgi:hypothetical protein
MRYLLTAAAAAFLLLPASQKASACGAQHSAEAEAAIVAQAAVPEATLAQVIDLSAKKEKVEYMKSAAGPEPTVKKHKKKKKHKKAKKKTT